MKQPLEPLPGETFLLAAASKPQVPDACSRKHQALQALPVAVHSEVVVVTSETSRERGVLVLDRVVPVAPAVLGDGLNRPS